MTVHYVYVHGDPVDSTQAIVHEIVPRLKAHHTVVVHHPNDPVMIHPVPGDVLIGHPNRYDDCAFRRAFAQPGWARRIVFAPFSSILPKDAALIDDLVVEADLFLALAGETWWPGIEDSLFAHWRHKMLPFELGINRAYYRPIKSRFNPPGQRRFLYIGNADALRGGDYLADLADANPDLHFGWVRTGDSRGCLDYVQETTTPGISRRMVASRLRAEPLGYWRHPFGLSTVATYDFVIACGRSDAMPCEILECAAWGLVPVTTPQCGYPANDWLTHIPFGQVAEASAILREMNNWPEAALRDRQAAGWTKIAERYTWDRAAAQVLHAIECPLPQTPDAPEWRVRAQSNRRELRRILRRERPAEMLRDARGLARRALTRLQHAV